MTDAVLKKDIAAGQARHSLSTIGGLIVGAGIANTDTVHSVVVLLDQAGVSPDIQAVIGLAVLLTAHVMSMVNKMQKDKKDA